MARTRSSRRCVFLWMFVLVSVLRQNGGGVFAYQIPALKQWSNQLETGYKRRVAANPSFPAKSITEVLLAAGTQLAAECNRRGTSRLLPEIDFVVPAIFTAVFGKYYRYVVGRYHDDCCLYCTTQQANKRTHTQSLCQIFELSGYTYRSSKPIVWNMNFQGDPVRSTCKGPFCGRSRNRVGSSNASFCLSIGNNIHHDSYSPVMMQTFYFFF
jgi:hypothetical protein